MQLDILTLDWQTLGRSNCSLHWPISNEMCQPWAYQYPARIISAIQICNDPELQAAANTVVSELACSASRIACAVSGIHAARVRGTGILFNKRISPVAAWLCGNEGLPRKISDIIPDGGPSKPGLRDWKTPLRSFRRSIAILTTGANRRIDIQNANDMVSRVIAMNNGRTPVWLFPERLPFTKTIGHVPGGRELTDALIADFRKQLLSLNELSNSLMGRAASIFFVFLNDFIGQAYCDLRAYKIWSRKERPSDSLLGGTPNVFGRLLGGLYREEGRRVLRCTHGGDRGFFDDSLWAFSELLESDEYWVHGPREAQNIARRLATQRIICPRKVPEIRAAGSPKHVARFLQGRECPLPEGNGKRVALIASVFTGEWWHVTFAFKPPDPLIADLQIYLLRTLRDAGYYVIVRPHPKGLLPGLGMVETFYGPYCDEILTGPFDSNTVDVDVLIFDFAGSAWFDALPTRKAILLVDTGDRQFDPAGKADLEERCAIVKTERLPNGGYWVDPFEIEDGVREALLKAPCTEKFAERYFGLSLV